MWTFLYFTNGDKNLDDDISSSLNTEPSKPAICFSFENYRLIIDPDEIDFINILNPDENKTMPWHHFRSFINTYHHQLSNLHFDVNMIHDLSHLNTVFVHSLVQFLYKNS